MEKACNEVLNEQVLAYKSIRNIQKVPLLILQLSFYLVRQRCDSAVHAYATRLH